MKNGTLKIGFIAGPAAGKTTTAADVFVRCKRSGIPTYYISEYAREAIDSGWKLKSVAEQFMILKEQRRREDIVPDNIQVMLTDSPTFLTFIYALWNGEPKKDSRILISLYEEFLKDISRYDYIILLNRVHPYDQDGTRKQSVEEADAITTQLKSFMDLHKIPYFTMDGNVSATSNVMEIIYSEL